MASLVLLAFNYVNVHFMYLHLLRIQRNVIISCIDLMLYSLTIIVILVSCNQFIYRSKIKCRI